MPTYAYIPPANPEKLTREELNAEYRHLRKDFLDCRKEFIDLYLQVFDDISSDEEEEIPEPRYNLRSGQK